MSIFYGATSIVAPLRTLLVMLEYNSNFSLGIFTSIFSLGAAVFVLIFNRFTKHGTRSFVFIIASALNFISAIILIFFVNNITIIIFNGVFTILKVTYDHAFDVSRNIILKKFNMYDYIAEFQCLVEECLEASRVVVFFIMAMIGLIGAEIGANGMIIALQILLIIAILTVISINVSLLLYEKKQKKHELV